MNRHWGSTRAVAMLDATSQWLAAIGSAGSRNHFVVRDLEALSLLAGRPDLVSAAASILRDLRDRAFTAGVISTSVDLSPLVLREPASFAIAESRFPAYTEQVRAAIVRRSAAHAAVFGASPDLDLARVKVGSGLDLEEFVSACAVAGHLEHALRELDSAEFEPSRCVEPRMVVCVEAFRADRLDLADRLIVEHFSTPGHFLLSVAAGLLGRVPWAGYPYPDY